MHWVYLSPHFDDVVLSCGGLVWDQLHAGHQVEIWTICAGEPRPGEPFSAFVEALHTRWQTGPEAVQVRRREDESAGQALGARLRYWDLPDCVYRRLEDGEFVVNGEEDLWQDVHPLEMGTVKDLRAWLACELRPESRLVSPMTLGSHVDHHLVRRAAEGLARPLWYYADFPYVLQHPDSLASALQPEWQQECFPISEAGLDVWQHAIAQYASQISTFWNGVDAMRANMAEYWQAGGGACLWHKPIAE